MLGFESRERKTGGARRFGLGARVMHPSVGLDRLDRLDARFLFRKVSRPLLI